MRLASSDGNSVTLRVDGYQFPAVTGAGYRDWDANWLVVVGEVVNGDRAWTFRDPSLTTWEARELASWLRSVADGSRRPQPIDGEGDDAELLVFTEPNLAFSLLSRRPGVSTIRVYLSLEAVPEDTQGKIFEYFVELEMPDEDIARAAVQWEAELRQFPVRA